MPSDSNNNNFFNKFSISLVVYYFIQFYSPPTVSIPVLVVLTMASLYNTTLWNALKRKFISTTGVAAASSKERVELLTALKQLSNYESQTRNWNRQRKLSQRRLTWSQQTMLDKIGYNDKIDKLDRAIHTNQQLINEIVNYTKLQNNVSYTELRTSLENGDNYRVIEALCHFQRDWSPLGDVEIQPILEYINLQTLTMDKSNTVVIQPGSGLGRVAHELALNGFAEVHSVEYSMLMKTLNEFVYSPIATYQVHPFIHGYSNQVSTASHMRQFELHTLGTKPLNLNITFADFNKFEINSNLENVVVVTVFFLDTLENLFQYLESIDKLVANFKGSKTWINVGPLKYGTRPKVELNLQELMKLVKLMGWNIRDQQDPKLLGYLTDLQSMWQGQYGVSMFSCTK